MRPIDGRPWRLISRLVYLPDGRELVVLSCSHERISPPPEDVRMNDAGVLKKWVRCVSCIPGVDAVVAIEQRTR